MISRICVSIFVIAAGATLIHGEENILSVKPIDDQCLDCICKAISNCNTTLKCLGNVCGQFKITRAYWADAKKPTLKLDNPDNNDAYKRCATNPECAARTVTAYMTRFAQDCNNDGVVDCYDYGAIHMLGGYGCKENLYRDFSNKFNKCMRLQER